MKGEREDTMAIRVLLADDHKIMRDSLRALFLQTPELELVGEATDGQEAVDLAAELLPDIVITDITMPRLDGPAATRLITARHPLTRVIALSMHTDLYYVREMQAAGAMGYVPKDEAYEVLATAIRTVHEGGTFFDDK